MRRFPAIHWVVLGGMLAVGAAVPALGQHSRSAAPSGAAHFSSASSGEAHFSAPSGSRGGTQFAPRVGPSGAAPHYGDPGRLAGGYGGRPPIYRGVPGRGGPAGERREPVADHPVADHPSAYRATSSRGNTTSARSAVSSPRTTSYRAATGSRGNHSGGAWHYSHGVRVYEYGYGAPVSPLGWWLGPYQFYPWLDADLSYDYWHDTGDQDTAIAMASTGADMVSDAETGPEYGAEAPPWTNGGDPYAVGGNGEAQAAGADAPASWTATQVDTGAPALTLVYKSGHSEQVANYVVSRSAVTVIDSGGVRSIPVADLDSTLR